MKERERRDAVPFSKWLKGGFVNATPGDVVDYGFIANKIEQISKLYKVKYFCADKWRLEYLRQLLPQGLQDRFIEIPQTMAGLSVGMSELERLFRTGEITHEADPLGRWTFGNVSIATDGNENMKPMKSKSVDRIDPIVALINAMSAAVRLEVKRSVYEDRGLRVI
jgi:phage terminase large subunit-like protein